MVTLEARRAMGALERAVLRGDWCRDRRTVHVFLRVAPDSTVKVTVRTFGASMVMNFDGTFSEAPYDPFHQALWRLEKDDRADFVLYETALGGLSWGADGLVGLVPAPGVRSVARVAVRLRPKGGAEEVSELVVRPTDAIVPLWRGSFVPAMNAAFHVCDFVEITPIGAIPEGHKPRLVVVMFRTMLRHWLARARLIVPADRDCCSASAPSLQTRAGVAAEPGVDDVVRLPDLRGALLDQGSEERTRDRTRVIFRELMEAAWRPERALARSMAMLDS